MKMVKFDKLYGVNNKIHRPTNEGPACIYYNIDGQIREKRYWVNGEEIFPNIN